MSRFAAGRRFRVGLFAAAVAAMGVPAAGAQQPQDQEGTGATGSGTGGLIGGSSGGGIVTEQLEPLMPSGESVVPSGESVVPRDERFQAAPFKAPEAAMVPELIAPVETELKAGARLRQLDKMTGEAETVELAAGEEVVVDRLRVKLEACRAPADNAEHGTMAFVQIWDRKDPVASPAFSGWMFAESPALSAMDHPRYDLWVISCTTASGDESSASR